MTKQPKATKPFTTVQIGIFCLLVGLIAIVTLLLINKSAGKNETMSKFAKCAAAGNPVAESYPRQCTDNSGDVYREPLEDVPEPYEQTETRRGKVTKFDVKMYAGGVDGYIEIETQPKVTFGAYIGSGGSPDCDRSLIGTIQSKEIQVGDTVEIGAKLAGLKPEEGQAVNDIGFYSVCSEGTFIKKLDPSALNSPNQPTDSNDLSKEPYAVIHYFKGFQPATLAVKAGTYITIKNGEAVQIVSDPHPSHMDNPELNHKKIEANESITFKLTRKGTFGYHNDLNPRHTGSITVE